MNITIIGAGSWGCALANIVCENKHNVILYDNNKETVEQINHEHRNEKVPGGILDEEIKATLNLKSAIDFAEIIVISVPTKVLRIVLNNIKDVLSSPKVFVNASKGLEPDTFMRVSEIIKQVIPSNYIKGIVALTGPSHAEEVIIKLPTTICSVSEDKEMAKLIQNVFSNHTNFRVYTSTDLLGAELCGAIKNVYAIASGMLEGLGFGDNARAGLITRSLVEMRRIVTKLGGKEETLFGLTGVGDLIVTTSSHHSRNFQAGVKLATGLSLEETVNSMSMVVEGARTCEAVYKLARQLNIETPIIDAVYDIIYLKKPVKQAVSELLMRSFKEE